MKSLGYLLFALLLVYFIFLIRQDIMDNLELKRLKSELIKSNAQQQKLNLKLSQRLLAMKDKHYIEKLARTRLGLVKRGETAYKVVK